MVFCVLLSMPEVTHMEKCLSSRIWAQYKGWQKEGWGKGDNNASIQCCYCGGYNSDQMREGNMMFGGLVQYMIDWCVGDEWCELMLIRWRCDGVMIE